MLAQRRFLPMLFPGKDISFTFIVTGHDTTSHTLAWTLLELAQRPDELHRCQVAADEILAGDEPHLIQLASRLVPPARFAVLQESYLVKPSRRARCSTLQSPQLDGGVR